MYRLFWGRLCRTRPQRAGSGDHRSVGIYWSVWRSEHCSGTGAGHATGWAYHGAAIRMVTDRVAHSVATASPLDGAPDPMGATLAMGRPPRSIMPILRFG